MGTILKCKMCGGDIEVSQDMTVGKCLFCGSTMTLPRIESEKKARMFNRAHEYRLNCEFDKAYDAYKTITEEDEQEAEAYWGMILSEYGVEYVEDPKDGKRIPTCHRTQITNIQNTTNYKMALQYADSEQKFMYKDEAAELERLQRKILAVSSKEEAYDVFICYKESEENGERTQDSILAQEIYNELNREGVRTFFSRISLEDHLGENYEPYIYSALSSSKVMLVVSTTAEHCDAVWVRNEWMRFLGFMKEQLDKSIIPVYKDMSPYELPLELSGFQAQDMSKVGAVQDLVHGVLRIVGRQRANDNTAAVNKLIYESRVKEEKTRKNKKILARIAIILGVLLAVCTLGFFGLKLLKKGREIKVDSGWPDASKYDVFTVDLNENNYSEYIEFKNEYNEDGSLKMVTICPQGADKGWIYVFGDHNLNHTLVFDTPDGFSGTISTALFGGTTGGYGDLIEADGSLKFVSMNKIDKWSYKDAYMEVKMKSNYGVVKGNPHLSPIFKLYYLPILEKYAPEKRKE